MVAQVRTAIKLAKCPGPGGWDGGFTGLSLHLRPLMVLDRVEPAHSEYILSAAGLAD